MNLIEQTHIPHIIHKLRQAPAARWFALAAFLLLLFAAYTALLTTGALDVSTVQIERWLLARPITRVDCSFYEWRNLGNPPVIVLFALLVGVACLLLRYRWTVLLWLAALLAVCAVCEVVGKGSLTQPVPHAVSFGMSGLSCPQIQGQPASVRLSAATGMWWNVPPASQQLIERIHLLAQRPFFFGDDTTLSSYPGGHAMRASFLGVLIAWLCWRHIRYLAIRVPAVVLVLVVSLGIGFIQFYIGAHLITDTLAGYLFGIAAACCAIGVLLLNAPKRRAAPAAETLSQTNASQE